MRKALFAFRRQLRRTPFRNAVVAVRHWGLTPADVFVASYPRSGNTWLKCMIANCIIGEPVARFTDKEAPLIPIVGYHRHVKPLLANSGRLIKTHEPYRPEYQRAIWIVRDPRDVVISKYKLALRQRTFQGGLSEFVREFVADRQEGLPSWKHNSETWLACPLVGTDRLLRLTYEDMRTNTKICLTRVLEFLGICSTEELIDGAIVQNSIPNMKERYKAYDKTLGDKVDTSVPTVNAGEIGGWRTGMSAADAQIIVDAFGETMQKFGYPLQ